MCYTPHVCLPDFHSTIAKPQNDIENVFNLFHIKKLISNTRHNLLMLSSKKDFQGQISSQIHY